MNALSDLLSFVPLSLRRCVPLFLLLAAAAGCESQPGEDELTRDAAANREAAKRIIALAPANLEREVNRRPIFRWTLPPTVSKTAYVTFKLFEAPPITDESALPAPPPDKLDALPGETEVAVVMNVGTESPAQLDLFNLPQGVVGTGDLWRKNMTQLKPNTWYRWKVLAAEVVANSPGASGDFYFMTRAEPAVVEKPEIPGNLLNLPKPERLPPQPIEELGSPKKPEPKTKTGK